MQFGTQVAGLDQCDTRVAYGNFLTSTPTKNKVCSNVNMDCWDDYEASMVAIHAPCDSDNETCNDTDNSYGGQWNKVPVDSLLLGISGNATRWWT